MDFELAMLETGYRKPLSSLVMLDKAAIQKTLRAHILLKVKPELDQFCEGLKTCGVMESTLQYPSLMAPCFTCTTVNLTGGT